MKKSKKPKIPKPHSLTKLCGFDLLIGQKYQEGWFREVEPFPFPGVCNICEAKFLMSWPLKRSILAFGHEILQHSTIYQCLACKHEWEVDLPNTPILDKPRRLKLNSFQLAALIKLAKDKGIL